MYDIYKMDRQCLFSIIIPLFNGTRTFRKCFDSIFSERLNADIFEVICVDDCSTDIISKKEIESYLYNGQRPENLYIIHHQENKRRGGACNTGVEAARGCWIVYIDCDDYFLKNGLSLLVDILKNYNHLDMLVYNYQNPYRLRCIDKLLTKEMSGAEFIQTQPVPWVSWCYAFKRAFLIDNNIKYEENVFFEDCDYVIRAILKAVHIQFIDTPILFYSVYEGQTSTINTVEKVEDLLKLTMRLKCLGQDYERLNSDSAQAVCGHQWFQYYSILKRYLWRLSVGEVYRLLKQYKPYDKGRGWLRIVPMCPMIYVCVAFAMRPFLLIASKYYRHYIKK